MARGVRIVDRDRGLKALVRRVAKGARGRAVKVGVLGDSGGAGGTTTVDVASIHEFGLGNHPERSFIRAWADQDKSEHEDVERRMGESVVRGQNEYNEALEKMGLLLAASAQKFIQDGRVTPATVKSGGGGNTTLIDTGQLVSSISHELE
jgi:hypothetical protein